MRLRLCILSLRLACSYDTLATILLPCHRMSCASAMLSAEDLGWMLQEDSDMTVHHTNDEGCCNGLQPKRTSDLDRIHALVQTTYLFNVLTVQNSLKLSALNIVSLVC